MPKPISKKEPLWRVSYRIHVSQNISGESHEEFLLYGKARNAYNNLIGALYRCERHLSKWEICLNRIGDPPFEKPKYSDSKS